MREPVALYAPLPHARVVRGRTPAGRAGLVVAAALLALTLSLPWWADAPVQQLVVELLYSLALAQSWNLLAGYGGMVSIGQQMFVGAGAYTVVVLALHLGLHPVAAALVAAPVAAVLALPVSGLLFRLQGPYLAVGSWVMAEVLRLLVANLPALGGGSGVSITSAMIRVPERTRQVGLVWLAALAGFGSVAVVYALLRSRLGLALTAIRDDPVASQAVGVPVRRVKRWVFLLAAAVAGLSGAVVSLARLRVAPDAAFSVDWSAQMIFVVVIGGIGTIEGPIAGTLVYFGLRELLADQGGIYLIVLGAVAIAAMLRARRGIWGSLAHRFDLHLFPVRRRLSSGAGPGSAPREATP
jgi:branched-chain amino acid transport system permease protein